MKCYDGGECGLGGFCKNCKALEVENKWTETMFQVCFLSLFIVGLLYMSMTKDSKIQQLEFELSQIPKVCIEQFKK